MAKNQLRWVVQEVFLGEGCPQRVCPTPSFTRELMLERRQVCHGLELHRPRGGASRAKRGAKQKRVARDRWGSALGEGRSSDRCLVEPQMRTATAPSRNPG